MDEQHMVIEEALEAKRQNPDGKRHVEACGVFDLSGKCTEGFGVGVREVGGSGQVRDREGVGVEGGSGGGGNVGLRFGFSELDGGSVGGEEVCLVNEMNFDVVDAMEAVRENVGVDEVQEFGNVGVKGKCCMPSDEIEGDRGEQMVYVGSAVGGRLGDNEREESCVDKGEQPELCGADLGKKMDISGDGILHYVGLPCEANIVGNAVHEMCRRDETGTNEDQIDNMEYNFSVGDIVWVKTKNQSWWPGRVRDCRDVSIFDTEANNSSSFLVSFFGSAHAAWCNTSQLKPFHDNFEFISRKNNSKSFVAAVKKAVHEFGRNVKLDMTCSCFLKGDRLPDTGSRAVMMLPVPERKSGRLEFLVNQLDPIRFLGHVRNLALVSFLPGMLNITTTQNSLAAFYQFMGHCHLPVDQLQDQLGLDRKSEALEDAVSNCGNVSSELDSKIRKRKCTKTFHGENGLKQSQVTDSSLLATSSEELTGFVKLEKSEHKSFGPEEKNTGTGGDSRERKKSKYLSYPYVNWDKGLPSKTEETETRKFQGGKKTWTGQFLGAPSTDEFFCGTRSQSKWAKNFINSCSPELLKTSSADMLAKLKCAAASIPYPKEYDNLDSTKWFYLKFRISMYNDKSIHGANVKNIIGQNEAILSKCPIILPARSNPGNEKVMSKHTEATYLQNESVNAGELPHSFLKDPLVVGHNAPSIVHKKQINQDGEEQMRLKTKHISGLSDVYTNKDTSDLFWREMSSVAPNGKPKRKWGKKIGEATFTCTSKKQVTTIPDFYRDNSINSGVVGDINRNFAGPSFPSVDLQLNCATALKANQEKYAGGDFATRMPDCSGSSGKFSSSVDVQPVVGTLTPEPVRRRRRRSKKGKADSDSSKTCHVSSIPDLNGTSTESASLGKKLPEINLALPEGKTEQKKRSRKQVALDLGTSLLLKFAPETALPSREFLRVSFCQFGPLKESESQSCKDSDTVEVPFLKTGDALEAFRSLEKCNPFGATLVNYRLHQHSPASTAFKPDNIPKRSRARLPVGGFLAPMKHSAPKPAIPGAPPLNVIKQNLEMMTSMLEKSGSNLSPEMRNNLEREIKCLLEKVSGMSGPSC